MKCAIVRFALLVPFLAGTPLSFGAAEKEADPVGSWQIIINRPGRPPQDTILKLERAGDRFVGVVTNGQGFALPIKDAVYKDGELSFHMKVDRQGQEIKMSYKAKLSADTMKGMFTVEMGKLKRDIPFEGRRVTEEVTLAGAWKINLLVDLGDKLQPTLRLKRAGGKLSGDYVSINGKETHIPEIKLKEGELSFDVPEHLENKNITLTYKGKVKGDAIRGTAQFTEGKRTAVVKFEAKRVQTPTANVAGTWKLRVVLKTGEVFEPVLKITQNGSTLSGTYHGEHGDTPLTDALVVGNEVTFEVARERDGKKYRLRYQGKVNGDVMKGGVDYTFDGMGGLNDFEGTRIEGGKQTVSQGNGKTAEK